MSAPACGWSEVHSSRQQGIAPVKVGDGWIDNGLLRVAWDSSGLLTSIRDVEEGREVIADGRRGNLFQLHEDNPRFFDAWDVDRNYLDHVVDLSSVDAIEIVECEPLRAGVRFSMSFGDSAITQTMRLAAARGVLSFTQRSIGTSGTDS